MNETWIPVVDYEGLYEVSNLGNVRSLDRKIISKSGAVMIFYGKQIRKRILRGGYVSVELNKNSHGKTFNIHRLVASAFIPNPENKPQVNHINSIRTDNRVENLEWCTNSENQKYAFKFGFQNSNHRIRPVYQMDDQGKIIALFESATMAAKHLGGNQAKISACALGKRKHTVGYRWQFASSNF